MAKSKMSCIGISARRSRVSKNVRSRASSSGVGRRERLLDFPIKRSSRHAVRASWTISGFTGSCLTLLAARRAGLLDDFRLYGELLDALSGAQDDSDPGQIICHGGGAGSFRAPGPDMVY